MQRGLKRLLAVVLLGVTLAYGSMHYTQPANAPMSQLAHDPGTGNGGGG